LEQRFHHSLILSLCLAFSACERPKVVASVAAEQQPKTGNIILARLQKIVIPVIEFEEVTVEDAIDFLRMRSFELEPGEPVRNGVSWIVIPKRGVGGPPAVKSNTGEPPGPLLSDVSNPPPKIHYRARNVGLPTALKEVARQAHLDAYLTTEGIVVCQAGDPLLSVGKVEGGKILKTLQRNSPDLTELVRTIAKDAEECTRDAWRRRQV
jgi:hypothetical protein